MPFTEIEASVDQDQAAQNMQPDLNSTLSVTLEHYRQKIAKNVLLCLLLWDKNIHIDPGDQYLLWFSY